MGRGRIRVEERIIKETDAEIYEATLIQRDEDEKKEK
ncbi:YhdX family protein [Bacillus alveayuensis]|jgi:hypothetical protein|uniref:Uncharacterized protein n=1 Tax=Aeribacillus alveayuensis TaxID=279215 RepID=A0ABT9VPM2_9BACI|nr:YhdX family protein [Bacillus alveayuensis]MDQ0162936.1 hypothetical protein [Bacillus alveayuensis]